MTNISVLILAKNEEKYLSDCIKIVGFNTKSIAESLGIKVIQRSLDGYFAEQRNFALKAAKNS